MAKIEKTMSFGDVIGKYPETAEVLMKHGMHCVGCHAAQFETIEEGCKAHGMSDEEVGKVVDEMNKIAEKKKGD